MTTKKILRMDDVGASSKHWEVYGKGRIQIGSLRIRLPFVTNFLFLKYLPCFRAWGRYSELTPEEWEAIFSLLRKYRAKLIVGITAAWIEHDGTATPFPIKFPEQAALIKKAQDEGIVEIANHGLSHCIIGKHLPRMFFSNRSRHREFWPTLNQDIHTNHILKSQKILEEYFGKPVMIFIPPGNVWSKKTYEALKITNIRMVISNRYMLDSDEDMMGITFLSDTDGYINFHDREIKLFGTDWLDDVINKNQ